MDPGGIVNIYYAAEKATASSLRDPDGSGLPQLIMGLIPWFFRRFQRILVTL